jgi:hypothetical protein
MRTVFSGGHCASARSFDVIKLKSTIALMRRHFMFLAARNLTQPAQLLSLFSARLKPIRKSACYTVVACNA